MAGRYILTLSEPVERMVATMTCLSKEHEFLQSTNTAMAAGLPAVLEAAGPKAHRLAKSFLEASQLVITSDLYFREAERIEVLGLDRGRAQISRQQAKFRNDACLEILEHKIFPAISEIREEFGETKQRNDCKRAFDFLQMEALVGLAGIDLTRREASIAGRLVTRTRTVADEGGIDGLCTVLEHRCRRLIELRQEREEHNNPVALVVGGAIAATGFLILGICSALSGGQPCSNPVVSAIAISHIMLGVALIVMTSGSGEDEDEVGGLGEG